MVIIFPLLNWYHPQQPERVTKILISVIYFQNKTFISYLVHCERIVLIIVIWFYKASQYTLTILKCFRCILANEMKRNKISDRKCVNFIFFLYDILYAKRERIPSKNLFEHTTKYFINFPSKKLPIAILTFFIHYDRSNWHTLHFFALSIQSWPFTKPKIASKCSNQIFWFNASLWMHITCIY